MCIRDRLWKVISVAGNYYIQTKNGGVIDIQNGTLNAGTNVQTFSWNGTNAQRWSFVPVSYTHLQDITIIQGLTAQDLSHLL